MLNGKIEIVVRKALLFYPLKRLGLDTDPGARKAQDKQIILLTPHTELNCAETGFLGGASMLELKLRDEFLGRRLKGTAIELSNESNTGATQVPAENFLEITYPTLDLLKGIEAVGPSQGRPVVVIGGLCQSKLA